MSIFRDWADHPSEAGKANTRTLDRRARKVVIDDDATTAREGPVIVCCAKRLVGADMLVWYGGLPPGLLAKIVERFPHMDGVADADFYLCDGCREIVRRERVIPQTDRPNWKNDPNSRRYKEKN